MECAGERVLGQAALEGGAAGSERRHGAGAGTDILRARCGVRWHSLAKE